MYSGRSTSDLSQVRPPPLAKSFLTLTVWFRRIALLTALLLSACISLHATAAMASPQRFSHRVDPASSSLVQYSTISSTVSSTSITQMDHDDSPSPALTHDISSEDTIITPPPIPQRYAKSYDITIVPDPARAGFAVKERIKLDNGESVTPTPAETPASIQEITLLRKRVVARLTGIEPTGDDPTVNLTLPDGSTLFVALCADGCPPTTVSVKLAPLVPRVFVSTHLAGPPWTGRRA
jgi:cytoskeletal protein RodZ